MAFVIADRVKETTVSTGTGALTLAGAITGFSTFASRCSVGDTLYYAIQAVDAGGVPTGDWECGLGTYSGANTLTRTTVTSSSASDAAVSFAAGDKQVYITVPAVQAAWARERLTADRTYYVRTDGSDSNTGLADTAGGAFLTGQKAIDTAASLDTATYNVIVQFADGTYTGAMTAKQLVGAGSLSLKGNSGTPSNVFFNVAGICLSNQIPTRCFIQDCKLQSTSNCLYSQNPGSYIGFSNIVFGTATNNHILVFGGGFIQALGAYSITGGAQSHWSNAYGNISVNNRTITVTGTPAFSVAFLWGDRGQGMTDVYGNTFSGSATGKRYQLVGNGVCFVNGAATTYLPGNVAGTTATGGQYV